MNVPSWRPLRLGEIEGPLARELRETLGIDVEACLECGKCSGGCSNGHVFDFTPRKIVQLVRLGAEETLAAMDALWICLSCRLCVDRCPAGIDIPRIMDFLRERAHRRGTRPARPDVALFHELLLASIERRGRVSEGALALRFGWTREARGRLKDAVLGLRLLLKGRFPFPVPGVKEKGEVRRLFERFHRRSPVPE